MRIGRAIRQAGRRGERGERGRAGQANNGNEFFGVFFAGTGFRALSLRADRAFCGFGTLLGVISFVWTSLPGSVALFAELRAALPANFGASARRVPGIRTTPTALVDK